MSIEMHAALAHRAASRVSHLIRGYKPCKIPSWRGTDYVCHAHTARVYAHNAVTFADRAAHAETAEQAEQYRRRAEWSARRAELAVEASTR